ncbi:hypothetical protein [Nocardia sp. NBC_00416]|uniref:hypothetical protein n=1 Tax=Nocardia sp. NBC_00416 TaxID=2975991 RepID=UPI002E1CA50D
MTSTNTPENPENLDADRDDAVEVLHQQQYEAADRADLARRFGAMAAALRDGDLPDTSEPVELGAHRVDAALADLTDLRADAAAAGHIPPLEARLLPVTPAGEAADTMAALDTHLSTGGRLPALWGDAHP